MKEALMKADGVVVLPLDLYNELVDRYTHYDTLAEELDDMRGRLADLQAIAKRQDLQICELNSTIESKNRTVEFWYKESEKYKKLLEGNVAEDTIPKPSKDCLTAMAEQSWHDCRCIAGGEEDAE